MKFWPSDEFEIETTMSSEDIVASFSSTIEPKKFLRLWSDHAHFQGDISHDGFKITRIIAYGNSFLPVIKGKFLPGDSGIKVAVRMGLHPFVAAFLCVWFGGVGLGCLVFLIGALRGEVFPSAALLAPFGMLVFGWVLVSVGFWLEADKQKAMLIEMFQRLDRSEQAPGSRVVR